MSFEAHANQRVNAVGLKPPLRQGQVASNVGMNQAIGRHIGVQGAHQVGWAEPHQLGADECQRQRARPPVTRISSLEHRVMVRAA